MEVCGGLRLVKPAASMRPSGEPVRKVRIFSSVSSLFFCHFKICATKCLGMILFFCSDQKRSTTIATDATEHNMIGAMSHPPDFKISNTAMVLFTW